MQVVAANIQAWGKLSTPRQTKQTFLFQIYWKMNVFRGSAQLKHLFFIVLLLQQYCVILLTVNPYHDH